MTNYSFYGRVWSKHVIVRIDCIIVKTSDHCPDHDNEIVQYTLVNTTYYSHIACRGPFSVDGIPKPERAVVLMDDDL